MQPSLEKLYKLLNLEVERGYDNRAVVGGLNKILPTWEAEARSDGISEPLIQSVTRCLNQYPALESDARADSLRTLWQSIVGTSLEKHPDFRRPRREPTPSGPGVNPPAPRHTHQPAGQNRPETPTPAVSPRSAQSTQKPGQGERQPLGPAAPRTLRRTIDPDTAQFGLNAPLTVLPGIGPKNAETLSGLGLETLGDLLYYFPRRYEDYSKLEPIIRLMYGEEVTVLATVQSIQSRPIRGGSSQVIEAVVGDGTGFLRVSWFNQPWLVNKLRPGTAVSLSGRIDQYLGRLVMSSPEWELVEQNNLSTNRIVPVYPLTARVTQNWLRKIIHPTVEYWSKRVPDYLPEQIREDAHLVDLSTALQEIHFPRTQEGLAAARARLAFDEIFLLQLGVLGQKMTWQQAKAQTFPCDQHWLEDQIARLPFPLTGAQQRAMADICADLSSGRPMNRLLQGDVGSGKTVVAALAAGVVVLGGAQAAIMAPTSILAEQHYHSFSRLLGEENEQAVCRPGGIRLLIGDTSEAEKREIREGLENGTVQIVIGTHALIEDPVIFQRLQLVVVDEQHRFGVQQRAALRAKGENPHLLVMTATPIPRSLALTVYGDLDLSVMDEMPAGRLPIETHVLYPRERERAYTMVHAQISEGRQAFVICPLVQESERDEEARAAVEEHARLQKEVFPRMKLGLLHGRMKPEEKDEVMARFRDGQYNILVSTSVVEVGVDVPNATMMIIEGANRFGLSQLHQFRGRVGRANAQSYCLLIPDTEDNVENQRLAVMAETNDGFVLAERDLEQRGPGDFLGTRQSGFAELRLASLTDVRLIEKARSHAQDLFKKDPGLEAPEHQLLSRTLARFWGQRQGDIS